MASSTKIDKTKLGQNVRKINSSLSSLEKELKNLHDYLEAMMKGNSDGPYWNGASAVKFYNKALGNLKNDIEDYADAYEKLASIAVKYEKLCISDKK